MKPHLVVVFFGRVGFEAVVHAPVAALGYNPCAVAVETQAVAVDRIGEFAHPEPERRPVLGGAIHGYGHVRQIERLGAIGVRPPESGIIQDDAFNGHLFAGVPGNDHRL